MKKTEVNLSSIIVAVGMSICSTAIYAKENGNKLTLESVVAIAASDQHEKALDLLAELRKAHRYDVELLSKAETAFRLARVAKILAPWEGSDFGAVPPWYPPEIMLSRQGMIEKKLNTAYFDSLIAHSIMRLETRSKLSTENVKKVK